MYLLKKFALLQVWDLWPPWIALETGENNFIGDTEESKKRCKIRVKIV